MFDCLPCCRSPRQSPAIDGTSAGPAYRRANSTGVSDTHTTEYVPMTSIRNGRGVNNNISAMSKGVWDKNHLVPQSHPRDRNLTDGRSNIQLHYRECAIRTVSVWRCDRSIKLLILLMRTMRSLHGLHSPFIVKIWPLICREHNTTWL